VSATFLRAALVGLIFASAAPAADYAWIEAEAIAKLRRPNLRLRLAEYLE